MKVLDGIKVVDLSRVLAGPYCAQLLADFGATVIKVESPEGDENRRWPPMSPDGQSANFGSVNRGKRSMVLNLKNPDARDVLKQLAAKADVLIHSFLPDTAALATDRATGATAVIHHHGLAKGLRETLCNHPRHNIGRAAGHEGGDQAHRFIGISGYCECRN